MKLVSYKLNGQARLGALQGDRVIDLEYTFRVMKNDSDIWLAGDMIDLLKQEQAGLDKVAAIVNFAQSKPADDYSHALAEVTLLPPVLNPRLVIALGRNYAAHATESGVKPPEYPMLFHKTAGALLGADGTIIIPPITEKVDYEGELAVVIGRRCKQVSPEEALDYVAGYTIANDISARDLQMRTSQFTAGKMLDTFAPLGPALVTRDEIPNPGNLSITTTLNGQVMQQDHTSHMIFDVPFTISYISQIATLNVGDVILTGTPEGVGVFRNPPVLLKAGDVVSVEIEGLGTLTNNVANQAV